MLFFYFFNVTYILFRLILMKLFNNKFLNICKNINIKVININEKLF